MIEDQYAADAVHRLEAREARGHAAEQLPAATRAYLRVDDDAERGRVPFVKLDARGIHIITPLGRLDEHDRTDHVISRERARAMARALLLLADAKVEVVGGTRTIEELPQ